MGLSVSDDPFLLEKPMKTCPVCDGTKVSPFVKTNPCMCCKGNGKITIQHYDALVKIQKEISSKIK